MTLTALGRLAVAVLALCAVGALLYVQSSSEIPTASTSSAVIARHAITHAVPLRDERDEKGFAFRVFFGSSGICAVLKPLLPPASDSSDASLLALRPGHMFRAVEQYQGWSDVVLFHLCIVTKLCDAPFTTSRLLTHEEKALLARSAPNEPYAAEDVHGNMPVSLQQCGGPLVSLPPRLEHLAMLTHQRALPKPSHQEPGELEELRHVSDAFIFDALAENHDREFRVNWKRDRSGRISIYNGLSMMFGPEASNPRTQHIFCDPSASWVILERGAHASKSEVRATWVGGELQIEESTPTTCHFICRFRNATVQHLRAMSHGEELSLGTRLKYSMAVDPLWPVVHHARFMSSESETEHFRARSRLFWSAVDERVQLVLEHIAHCEQKFGMESVLL